MSERKRAIFSAIVVSLLAILTGLFLSGALPSLAAHQRYDERRTTTTTITTKVIHSYDGIPQHDERIRTNTTVTKVIHSHDGLPLHQHVETVVVTTTETTTHGYFQDFNPAETSVPVATVPETNPNQQSPEIPEITSTSTPNSTPLIQPEASTSEAGNNTIRMYGMSYVPNSLTVPAGSTVTWTQVNGEGHPLAIEGYFETSFRVGDSFSWTFTEPGIYRYFCPQHGEGGRIIVK